MLPAHNPFPATQCPSASPFSALLARIRPDFTASLVVFLVALPLCVGVAVASGVPAELGLITGIVGGLVTGLLPGSTLQVSGPAAGLTVLTLVSVQDHGVRSLGAIVLAAGLLQILFGLLRLGRWFQAISSGVVQGMLAGIGLVLVSGQIYSAVDRTAPGSTLANVTALPGLTTQLVSAPGTIAAAGLAALTLLIVTLWPRVPVVSRHVPGSLAAVMIAIGVTSAFRLPVKRLSVGTLADAVQPPGAAELAGLIDGDLLSTAVIFALIASAESLFSAAAVDRMHDGPRTRYNAELIAQGAGNAVCGMLGALPMTAVIVRSAANVNAGARSRAARVLHGVWLLVFVVAAPQAFTLVPIAALAALLLHAGWKLLCPGNLVRSWRTQRGETIILIVTAVAIVATSLFEGVVIGVVAALAKCAWELSHVQISTKSDGDVVHMRLTGHATFLRVPCLSHELDALPEVPAVHLDLSGLSHYDHACRETVRGWVLRQRARGRAITLSPPSSMSQSDDMAMTNPEPQNV